MAKGSLKSYFERLPYEELVRIHGLYEFMELRYKGDSSRLEALGNALCGKFSDLKPIVTGKGSTVNTVRSGERVYKAKTKRLKEQGNEEPLILEDIAGEPVSERNWVWPEQAPAYLF